MIILRTIKQSFSFFLSFTLLLYFTGVYYLDLIYIKWTLSAVPFALLFNLFGALLITITLSPLLLVNRFTTKSNLISTIITTVFILVITIPNFLFFDYYQGPPTLTVALQAGDPAFLKAMLPLLTDGKFLLIYFGLPLAIAALFCFFFSADRIKAFKSKKSAVIAFILVIGLSSLAKDICYKGRKNKLYVFENNPYNILYRVYITHGLRGKNSSVGNNIQGTFTKSDLEDSKIFLAGRISSFTKEFTGPPIWTELSKELALETGITPNIVVIIMESLSSFHINDKVMPLLSDFGKSYPNSLIFKNFMAVSNQTVKGQYSIFCGSYPSTVGKISTDYPDLKQHCLPHILKDKGYHSFALTGINKSFHRTDILMEKVMGFDKLYDIQDYDKSLTSSAAWGASDLSSFKNTLKRMKEARPPFIAQYLSVNFHGPYSLPDDYKEIVTDSELMANLPVAQQILHYNDKGIEYFLNEAKKLDSYKNTIFVITADTGGGKSAIRDLSEFDLFEIRNKIPLIIYSPLFSKLKKAKEIETPMNQYSIAPLLLDLMRVKSSNHFIGLNAKLYSKVNREALNGSNSYIQTLPNITRTHNRQMLLIEQDKIVLVDGFRKRFMTKEDMSAKKFSDDFTDDTKNRLSVKFEEAFKFWSKGYMPYLHFNKIWKK